MKVLFIDTVHKALQTSLEEKKHICVDGTQWNKEKILNDIHEYDGIVIRSRFKTDKEFIDKAINLKFIARAGAGMENIDFDYASSKGIHCFNAPEGNRNAVSEHALGMLLSAMNNLVKANNEVKKGIWLREENRGTEISGKTIGIIGFGNTGKAFADLLSGFNIQIIVSDPYITPDTKRYPYVIFNKIELLYEKCDIVSLHVPLSDETKFMVNESFISKFKKPFFLINTSRGKVVNTHDVVNALKNKKLTGAALDVLEYEKLSFESLSMEQMPDAFKELISFENVILSPHIAGWTFESHRKISEVLAEKINKKFVL